MHRERHENRVILTMDREELNQTLHGVSLEEEVLECLHRREKLLKWVFGAVNYGGNGKYFITVEIETEETDETH